MDLFCNFYLEEKSKTNTLAYYNKQLIMAVQSYIVQAFPPCKGRLLVLLQILDSGESNWK